jgi:hypothetical protein
MDFVTFTSKSFFLTGENLLVACESNDDVEAHVMVNKGTIACGVFSIVHNCFYPTHDEEFVEEMYVLVQALEECNAKVFGTNCLSFQIIGKLNSIAPNMCVP